MANKLLSLVHKGLDLMPKNKAKTLACANAIGVVVTAGISFRTGMEVQKKIDNGELEKTDILKAAVKVGACVAVTEVAGIGSYRTSAKTIADLTMGLTSAKREYEALENKIRESVGDEKANEIVKEATEKAGNDIMSDKSLVPDVAGFNWFKDDFTGACFYTTEGNIWKAWNKVVGKVKGLNREKVAVYDFYYNIKRNASIRVNNTMISQFGWDGEDKDDLYMGDINLDGVAMLDDGTPCRRIAYWRCEPHILVQ